MAVKNNLKGKIDGHNKHKNHRKPVKQQRTTVIHQNFFFRKIFKAQIGYFIPEGFQKGVIKRQEI